jgi:hypothetical protein
LELKLKKISKDAIAGAIAKAEHFRLLNEPGEAESICRDILAADPGHQDASRLLGLVLADQFTGGEADPFDEAERAFAALTDSYDRVYHKGVLRERRAKAGLRVGEAAPKMVATLLREALRLFAEAEKIRPPGNDETILRWNRCIRLILSRPELEWAARDAIN